MSKEDDEDKNMDDHVKETPDEHDYTSPTEDQEPNEMYIIRIARKPELRAIERSLNNFEEFRKSLETEILKDATASVREELELLLPSLPPRNEQEPLLSLARPLQEFLQAVFQIPRAVHSEALASFLALSEAPLDITDTALQHHMYLDYLLPSAINDDKRTKKEYHAIPRGKFMRSVGPLLPGFWVVWRFYIDSGSNVVEFSLFIDQVLKKSESGVIDQAKEEAKEENEGNTKEAGQSSEESTKEDSMDNSIGGESCTRELVHREICPSSTEPVCGSYRFPPNVSEAAQATFEFANVGKLSLLRGSRVRLECAAVPHEAFRAACEAARDQNDADARRLRSPLLYAVLDSPQDKEEQEGNYLVVEPHPESDLIGVYIDEEDASPPDAVDSHKDGDTSVADMIEDASNKEKELQKLRAEISQLHKEKDFIHDELSRITKLANDGKRTLQLMVSEKRIWSVARDEIQGELSRLSNDLSAERQEKIEIADEFEMAKQEVARLRAEITILKDQIPSEEEVRQQKEILETTQKEFSEMQTKTILLEEEVKYLKTKNAGLEKEVDEKGIALNEQASQTKTDLDEARMLQRILEGKVRHMEQELRRLRSAGESKNSKQRPKASRRFLDPKVESFKHKDDRLNTQLCNLRERHAQLAVLLEKNPNNPQNMELIGKIEKAIHDIVSSGL